MTKCAGCRVRHLKCDTLSTCIECEKSGRECVRLNVRFRHLVCPSARTTRADYCKYEFFFDGEQTWIDTNGKIEFIAESETSLETSPTDDLESHVFDAIGRAVESRQGPEEQPSSAFLLGSNSHRQPVQAPMLDDDVPQYMATLERAPHDPPDKVLLDEASKKAAYPSREASEPGEKPPSNTNVIRSERMLPALELAQPFKSLQEGKLLQHFVTHLAPWVCTNVLITLWIQTNQFKFDVGDSKRHFGKIATRMAASSPLLMTVILAIAALHHSRVNGQSDLYNAMTYHARCLNMIVPMLNDSDRVNDDCILITTTILHLFDGLECKLAPQSFNPHVC